MNTKRFLQVVVIIASMVLLPCIVEDALSLPQDPNVVKGKANIDVNDNVMNIEAANKKTIIDYSSFDINEGESVYITLPTVKSEILNRVLGPDKSNLLGDLSCNGIFILVNQKGIYVGPNANIDVGSLILSTRAITDDNFMNGNYLFQKIDEEKLDYLLKNAGTINIKEGGFGALIGGAIENQGTILAPLGKVVLANGEAIRLDISDGGLIGVAIEEHQANTVLDFEGKPITDAIKNTGTIEANGGMVILKENSLTDVFTKAINLEGKVIANYYDEHAGKIKMVAEGDIDSTGELEALGGEIDIETKGDVKLLGKTRTRLLTERGASLKLGGTVEVEKASLYNEDGAVNLDTGDYSGTYQDAGDIIVNPDALINLTGSTVFRADYDPGQPGDQDGTGKFDMKEGSSVTGNNNDLTLYSSEDGNLQDITGVGVFTLYESLAGSKPTYFSDPLNAALEVTDFRIESGRLNRFTGTYPDFNIYDVYGLQAMKGYLKDANVNFMLNNDIDASGTVNWNSGAGFEPIGILSNEFRGDFEGNNKTITGLTINRNTTQTGLFGRADHSRIQNVGLLDGNITGGNWAIGGLVGIAQNSTQIINSYYIGDVSGSNDAVGGLVGHLSYSSVTGSYALGNVSGVGKEIGGLVGYAYFANITDSHSRAAVNNYGSFPTGIYTGGLVGILWSSHINRSFATGDVTGGYQYVGGLVGLSQTSSTISNSYATGNVNGSAPQVGGLAGGNVASTISNSYATGNVNGTDNVGGLVGQNYASTINNSYATGNVTGVDRLGGLIGNNHTSTINNSYATGNVTATGGFFLPRRGGLTGYEQTSINSLINCWWYNNINKGIGGSPFGAPFQKVGHYELASAVSDFYGTGGGTGGAVYSTWTFGEGNDWNAFSGMFPRLDWEWSPNITTLLQLQNMNLDLTENYTLMNDIDATETRYWNPDGSGGYYGFDPVGDLSADFTGSLDGQGHVISDLLINRTAEHYVGLFGITDGATISNLGLEDLYFEGDNYVGGLVGRGYGGGIQNSYTTGVISNSDYCVGGLLGYGNIPIQKSYSSVDIVLSKSSVGGLVGYGAGLIENSYATGNIEGQKELGGLAGYLLPNFGIVRNCYATGNVTGSSFHVGGLVGRNYGDIENSFATGTVIGNAPNDSVGPFAGLYSSPAASYTNCYYSGTATNIGTGGTNSAGISTTVEELKVYDYSHPVYDQGNPNAWDFNQPGVWIMAGYPHLQMEHTTTIENVVDLQLMALDLDADYTIANNIDASPTREWNSYFDGSEWRYYGFTPVGNFSTRFTGTLDGQDKVIDGLFIDRSTRDVGLFGMTFTGFEVYDVGLTNVDINNNERNVGGLVGRFIGTISNSYTTGNVSATRIVGGLVGDNNGSISGSYSTCDVSGGEVVGGLVGGNNLSGSIDNSYATGMVYSSSVHAGGLAGTNDGSITDSYATGTVDGLYNVGGLVGINDRGNVIRCYATGDVYARNHTAGGLVGWLREGNISESFATGNVYSSVWFGDGHAGGLVGYAGSSSTSTSISNSYATGNVESDGDWAGGLIGFSRLTLVTNCYSTGIVDTPGRIGGLAGGNWDGIYTNCFWDTETSGLTTSGGGAEVIGKTTAEMMQLATFNPGDPPSTSDWGISYAGGTTWRINEGETYPYLRWRYPNGAHGISGIAYRDMGETPMDPNVEINLVINGEIIATDLTAANGFYYFLVDQDDLSLNDAVLAYINDDAVDGNAVANAGDEGMPGLELYGDTVIGSHYNGPLTHDTFRDALGDIVDDDILFEFINGQLVIHGHFYIPDGNTMSLPPGRDNQTQIEGVFYSQGTEDNWNTLQSTTPGEQWYFIATNKGDFDYTHFIDAYNLGNPIYSSTSTMTNCVGMAIEPPDPGDEGDKFNNATTPSITDPATQFETLEILGGGPVILLSSNLIGFDTDFVNKKKRKPEEDEKKKKKVIIETEGAVEEPAGETNSDNTTNLL